MLQRIKNKLQLKILKRHLGYDDDQMDAFLSHPKNLEMAERIPDMLKARFEFRVIKAHGCACKHKVDQTVVVNGDGSLATNECPDKMCMHLLHSVAPIVYAAQEFVCEGISADRLKFRHASCIDAGVMCGGIGNVVVELVPSE